MFSKKVKGKEIESKTIESIHQKNKLSDVISSLLEIGKRKKLKNFRLSENCLEWIEGLFSSYPDLNELYMRFLIRDFTNSMNTAMRTEDKYVISILTNNRIILCHSKVGEKTITPNWKVIDRMLDKDNVIRFVSFEMSDKELNIVFYEDERTVFFVNWLGIPENEVFYGKGGKNRFYSVIHGLPITLELTDEDFEKILDNKELKIQDGIITFPEPIREFDITEIKRGNKPYKTTNDFLLEFIQRNYDLLHYSKEYKKLNESLDPYKSTIIEDRNKVIIPGKYPIKKENNDFEILFCNEKIEITDRFLEKIRISIINGEKIKLFHAGMNIEENALKINKLEIFNRLNTNLTKPVIDYLNHNDHSEVRKNELLYTIFNLLHRENNDLPIAKFLNKLSIKFIKLLDFSTKISEDNVIELKSRDYITNKNEKTNVSRLGDDIKNKMKISKFKLYIIGYDERIKKYEPLPSHRFNDSRINNLTARLKEYTNLNNLDIFKINYDSDQCILMLAVKID